MARLLTLGAVSAVVGFALIQLYRPPLPNPPVTAEIQAPAEVKQILRERCYSCHSNEVSLPWFDRAAPAYWIVQHDVTSARQHLNFSELGAKPAAVQRATLFEAVSQVQLGAMPLPRYAAVHRGAYVRPEELATIKRYLETPVAAAGDAPPKPAQDPADAQYEAWIAKASQPLKVQPEWNGIAFLPDYKNWKAISSTDRWDNHTLRQILGNEVAVKAIAEGKTNPWPDGTAFAKVAWAQRPDGRGGITTGAFLQVEFMIRDSKRYASTEGWGWARWRGDDLKPYGKDAGFVNECISCHEPMKHNDHVFTLPIGLGTGGAQ